MTALTPGQRAVLRAYGRGATVAQQTGRTPEQVGKALLALCQLNRQYARELARTDNPVPEPVPVEDPKPRVTAESRLAQVADLAAQGWQSWRIANHLAMGVRTVKRYRALAATQANQGVAA
jgi:DNA-binding NarL/FixJ family response regulator